MNWQKTVMKVLIKLLKYNMFYHFIQTIVEQSLPVLTKFFQTLGYQSVSLSYKLELAPAKANPVEPNSPIELLVTQ